MGFFDKFKKSKKEAREIEMPPSAGHLPPPELPPLEPIAPGDGGPKAMPPMELPPLEPVAPEPAVQKAMPPPETKEPAVAPPQEPMPPPEVTGHSYKENPVIERPKRPIFVKIDDYRAVLSGTNMIKNNLKEAENIVARLGELRSEKDTEFEKLRNTLEDMQRKLDYIDKTVFESKGGGA